MQSKFLDHIFCHVEGREFWNADTDKCCHIWVSKLSVNVLNSLVKRFRFVELGHQGSARQEDYLERRWLSLESEQIQ